jgi:plastocyanin
MRYLIIALVVIVIAAGTYFVFRGSSNTYSYSTDQPANSLDTGNTAQNPPIPNPVTNTTSPATTPITTPAKTSAKVTVTYTDSGFLPSTVTINAGMTVIFQNNSSNPVWVASNPHPTHTDYPGFDALRPYQPGESYAFTFFNKGTWGYHNHRNPSEGGTVVVQ